MRASSAKTIYSNPANDFVRSVKWNRLRGLTMFVFSFGVESLELSVKLGRLVIFDFLGNCLL